MPYSAPPKEARPVFKSGSMFLVASPKAETYTEALELMRELDGEIMDTKNRLAEDTLVFIRQRFELGRLADQALHMTNNNLKAVAEAANILYQTLYDAHRVYQRHRSRGALEASIARWREEGRSITWRMVRNEARKALPQGDKEEAEVKLSDQIKRLEDRARRLEEDAADLYEQAQQYPALADEADGVATKAREVAYDTKATDWTAPPPANVVPGDPRPRRVTDDEYLEYIRGMACLNCRAVEGVIPHHLDRGGMGTKGPDYFTVPLCQGCHDELHQQPEGTFWGPFNPWEWAARAIIAHPRFDLSR